MDLPVPAVVLISWIKGLPAQISFKPPPPCITLGIMEADTTLHPAISTAHGWPQPCYVLAKSEDVQYYYYISEDMIFDKIESKVVCIQKPSGSGSCLQSDDDFSSLKWKLSGWARRRRSEGDPLFRAWINE